MGIRDVLEGFEKQGRKVPKEQQEAVTDWREEDAKRGEAKSDYRDEQGLLHKVFDGVKSLQTEEPSEAAEEPKPGKRGAWSKVKDWAKSRKKKTEPESVGGDYQPGGPLVATSGEGGGGDQEPPRRGRGWSPWDDDARRQAGRAWDSTAGAYAHGVRRAADVFGQYAEQVRKERSAESEATKEFYAKGASDWEANFPYRTSTLERVWDPVKEQWTVERVPGPKPPPKYVRKMGSAYKTAADEQFRVNVQAKKAGVEGLKPVLKRKWVEQHHQVRDRRGNLQWKGAWVEYTEWVPKSAHELAVETHQWNIAKEAMRIEDAQLRAARAQYPFRVLGGMMDTAISAGERVSATPMGRAVGTARRAGTVTPMGIKGGPSLFAQRVIMPLGPAAPTPPMGRRMATGIPSLRLPQASGMQRMPVGVRSMRLAPAPAGLLNPRVRLPTGPVPRIVQKPLTSRRVNLFPKPAPEIVPKRERVRLF